MSDTASQHTFGRASHTHRFTASSTRDASSPPASITSSRSSSRASARTAEQFNSDDELEIDYYEHDNLSPVTSTFANYDLVVDNDEDTNLVYPRPLSFHSSTLDEARGSLSMAIPGAIQSDDAYSTCSQDNSIFAACHSNWSWDDSSTHRSSHSGEDLVFIIPNSEPLSRADWFPPELQSQAEQPQATDPSDNDGRDPRCIPSRHSEDSVRSVNTHILFAQGAAGPLPRLREAESSTTLPFEDTLVRRIQKHERAHDILRYYWSFQREKADASSNSSVQRQQAHHHRTDKSRKESCSRAQEMWRCGHVGRFKVDKLVFKPQPTKGLQQRIHIRHIPDPFLMGNTTSGPHSVIHKHPRAVAFSIFRSRGLFSGPSGSQMRMNMRSGTMLAPKKVQEQYTSTQTMRRLSTYGLLDNELRAQNLSSQDKEKRRRQEKAGGGKGKVPNKDKGKEKSVEEQYRANPTEKSECGSAESATNSALKHVISAPERPALKIQFPSSISSSTVCGRDSASRPASARSSLPPSAIDVPDSETSSIPLIRYDRDHCNSFDLEDNLPVRTTHAEAFSALDLNDIQNSRAKANSRVNGEPSSTLVGRFLRVLRGNMRTDDHSSGIQSKTFQPPWLTTSGGEKILVHDDFNASFRDVGLLPTNSRKSSKLVWKRKSSQGILDQVPDDCPFMLLPLWPGEMDVSSVHAETCSAASFITVPEDRQYLLVYYVPFEEANSKSKKLEKAGRSGSFDSRVKLDPKAIYLPTFRVVARAVTYDELRLSGVRIPSDGLAVNGREWESTGYSACIPLRDAPIANIVVCQCRGRDSGFDFSKDGLLELGLCTREDVLPQSRFGPERDEREGTMVLTPIGRAVVEMIWLGCLAITSFGPT